MTVKDDGTVSRELREVLVYIFGEVQNRVGFGQTALQRLLATEMYLRRKAEEPKKWECEVVCEITVAPDMTNFGGTLHGGCVAFLVDNCTSLALSLLQAHLGKSPVIVSQTLNLLYHAPAPEGVNLKIVSQTIASGSRITSARCEIYDTTNNRLVATGVHAKMESKKSLKALL